MAERRIDIVKFEKPEMETVTFDAEDVIVTSGMTPCSPHDCPNVGSSARPGEAG